MFAIPASPIALRRPLFLGCLFAVVVLFLMTISAFHGGPVTPLLFPTTWTTNRYSPQVGLEVSNRKVGRRLRSVRKECRRHDRYEALYGRANIRMSRAYEGSRHRIERFINKVIRGDPIVVGAIGGSVTKGHGVDENERWLDVLTNILKSEYPETDLTVVNGGVPASGSDYFSFCFPLHIPQDTDLVFVELAVNDEGVPEHSDNMDNLIRGLLEMENGPAVVLLEVAAFSNGLMSGGGGRMHLPVAQYYDVPVINQRHPLVSHFSRFPEIVPQYFVVPWWGGTDTRHINGRGHEDLANLIGSLLRDITCDMVSDPFYFVPHAASPPMYPVEALPEQSYDQQLTTAFPPSMRSDMEEVQRHWPELTRSYWHEPSEKEIEDLHVPPGEQIWPGLWTPLPEYGHLPRLRAMEPWNPNLDHRQPPFRPHCLSTRALEPKYNLTPTANEGWRWWVREEQPDKPYLIADEPGATVSFELDVIVGIVKMYSLRSMSYGFGKVFCWMDDDEKNGQKIDGYWEDPNLNIGRFTTLGENLSPGRHKITCKLLEETNDPEGRHSFRLISVMSR